MFLLRKYCISICFYFVPSIVVAFVQLLSRVQFNNYSKDHQIIKQLTKNYSFLCFFFKKLELVKQFFFISTSLKDSKCNKQLFQPMMIYAHF